MIPEEVRVAVLTVGSWCQREAAGQRFLGQAGPRLLFLELVVAVCELFPVRAGAGG